MTDALRGISINIEIRAGLARLLDPPDVSRQMMGKVNWPLGRPML